MEELKDVVAKVMQIPDITQLNKFLFVGPHPDDIEIGAGGLVSRLIREKKEVYFLICTDGGSGTKDIEVSSDVLAKVRRHEVHEACDFLGVKDYKILDYEDGGIYDVNDMATSVAKYIQEVLPDVILCPDPLLKTETHPDHINCGIATRSSLLIASYPNSSRRHNIDISNKKELPSGITLAYYYTDRPNTIISLTPKDLINQIQAIDSHKSQVDESMVLVQKYLVYRSEELGKTIDSTNGEAYYVLSPLHQHCFLEKI